jgi:DNA-binding NarL/FixJ family response regulator
MKLLLVDDHLLFREGLKLILKTLDVCAVTCEAGSLDEALRVSGQNSDIDLVLFDLGLPGKHGMDALSEFRRCFEALPVVVLSGLADQATIINALERGAMGFIPKSMSSQSLHDALQIVLSGGVFVPPLADAGTEPFVNDRASSAAQPLQRLSALGLTARQMQVFRLIVQGKPNKVIARDLGVAESTVKSHVKPILKALNVTSRVGAILEMGRTGITFE